MSKPTYRVDLVRQMADCDANYMKIMKLLPDDATADHYEFALPAGSTTSGSTTLGTTTSGSTTSGSTTLRRVGLTVVDRAKYTTTVNIQQEASSLPWEKAHCMSVRIYHDARMAEVVACQKKRNFRSRYEYPNDQQFHPDEKAQLNRFLGEWLSYCLDHGLSIKPVLAFDQTKCD